MHCVRSIEELNCRVLCLHDVGAQGLLHRFQLTDKIRRVDRSGQDRLGHPQDVAAEDLLDVIIRNHRVGQGLR